MLIVLNLLLLVLVTVIEEIPEIATPDDLKSTDPVVGESETDDEVE